MRSLCRLVSTCRKLFTGSSHLLGHIGYMTDDLAQILNHMVERAAQSTHFVIGCDLDMTGQIAIDNLPGFLHQMPDGVAHPAVENADEHDAEYQHDDKGHDNARVFRLRDGARIIRFRCDKNKIHITTDLKEFFVKNVSTIIDNFIIVV